MADVPAEHRFAPALEYAIDGRSGEHPSVVLRDVAGRPRPNGHIIAFANEKGGVGKSTLAFHCALGLAHLGKRVLTIDCDRRQQTLNRLLEARDGTIRTLSVSLPQPQHVVLDSQSGAMLLQEMERVGRECDFILVDLAGQDLPTGRRAIAIADTVVTPVNASPADVDALGSINPVNRRLRHAGSFARMVADLRHERNAMGLGRFDWVVVNNRVRHCERRLIASADQNLATMSDSLGFRLIHGLTERLAYRDLLTFGLCHFDLKFIPGLGRMRNPHSHELMQMIDDLELPPGKPMQHQIAARSLRHRASVSQGVVESYRAALFAATPVHEPAN